MTVDQYPKVYLYRRIVQAKIFMDNNYSEKIDLNNIAEEASFSKFHFIRLFRNVYGKTPHQYLISARINKAQQLLRAGKPVSAVCDLVGFDSLTSFSGLFKRSAGVSPSVYLAAHKQIKVESTRTPLAFVPGCYALQNGWL